MVYLDMFPKYIVRVDVKSYEVMNDVKLDEVNDDIKPDDVKSDARLIFVEVDFREQFINKQEFIIRENMLQWVRTEAEIGIWCCNQKVRQ